MRKVAKCRVCSGQANYLMVGQLIQLDVTYFECVDCSYVQTEEPSWLERAYSDAINVSDTGIMIRNEVNTKIVLATLFLLNSLHGKVVDCAGGYGILVRKLRDIGVEAYWSDRYCENLLAKGFEYTSGNAELVTSFESFEHFVNPAQELDKMLEIAPNVLFSTELIANPAPAQSDWWYYGKEHGQHIGFFRVQTLQALATSRGKHLLTDGHSYHLISDKKISLASWRAARFFARKFPGVFGRRLVSKTFSDYEKIAAMDK